MSLNEIREIKLQLKSSATTLMQSSMGRFLAKASFVLLIDVFSLDFARGFLSFSLLS
jgi:hypothetical protein